MNPLDCPVSSRIPAVACPSPSGSSGFAGPASGPVAQALPELEPTQPSDRPGRPGWHSCKPQGVYQDHPQNYLVRYHNGPVSQKSAKTHFLSILFK